MHLIHVILSGPTSYIWTHWPSAKIRRYVVQIVAHIWSLSRYSLHTASREGARTNEPTRLSLPVAKPCTISQFPYAAASVKCRTRTLEVSLSGSCDV